MQTEQKLSQALELCLQNTIDNNSEYVMEVLGLTGMERPEVAERNGRNLGSEIVAKCDFLRAVSGNLNNPKIPKSGSFSGKLLDIEQAKEVFLLMQDDKMRKERFRWPMPEKGREAQIGNAKTFIGKNIEVIWEIYFLENGTVKKQVKNIKII